MEKDIYVQKDKFIMVILDLEKKMEWDINKILMVLVTKDIFKIIK